MEESDFFFLTFQVNMYWDMVSGPSLCSLLSDADMYLTTPHGHPLSARGLSALIKTESQWLSVAHIQIQGMNPKRGPLPFTPLPTHSLFCP